MMRKSKSSDMTSSTATLASVNFSEQAEEKDGKSPLSWSRSPSLRKGGDAATKQQMASLVRIISELSNSVKELRSRVDKQETELQASGDSIESLRSRIDEQQTELETTKERLLSSEQKTEELETTVRNQKAELDATREHLSAFESETGVKLAGKELNMSTSNIVSILAESLATRIIENNPLYNQPTLPVPAPVAAPPQEQGTPAADTDASDTADAAAADTDAAAATKPKIHIVDSSYVLLGANGVNLDPLDDAVITSLMRYENCINLDGDWPGDISLTDTPVSIPRAGILETTDNYYAGFGVDYPAPLGKSGFCCVMGAYIDLMPRFNEKAARNNNNRSSNTGYGKDRICIYFPTGVIDRYRAAIEAEGYVLNEDSIATHPKQKLVTMLCNYYNKSTDGEDWDHSPKLAILMDRERVVGGKKVVSKAFDNSRAIETFYETVLESGKGKILKGCVFGEFGIARMAARGAADPLRKGSTVSLVFRVLGFHAFYDSTKKVQPMDAAPFGAGSSYAINQSHASLISELSFRA